MKKVEKAVTVLLILTIILAVLNTIQLSQLNYGSVATTGSVTTEVTDVLPRGTPKIYGEELGVSYDDISSLNQQLADLTIRKLALLDDSINLEGKDLERYISIALSISCEYCCGAESIIFPNGEKACGCAHSYAMRGLAKYIIKEHNNEYTNDEILEELGKWKTLFFPTQIIAKAEVLKKQDVELNYINLASNKYRGVEKGVQGGMVGGC